MKTRKGVAALEFVLALPIIFSMTAVIFWLGRASSTVAITDGESRGAAWSQRANADPGELLKLDAGPATGFVKASATRNSPTKPFSMSFTSTDGTVFKEWTFEDLPFEELPPASRRIEIHGDVLRMLVNANPRTLSKVQPILGMLGDVSGVMP